MRMSVTMAQDVRGRLWARGDRDLVGGFTGQTCVVVFFCMVATQLLLPYSLIDTHVRDTDSLHLYLCEWSPGRSLLLTEGHDGHDSITTTPPPPGPAGARSAP